MRFSDLNNVFYSNSTSIKSKTIICGYCDRIIAPSKGYSIINKSNAQRTEELAGYIYICPNCNKPIFYNIIENTLFPEGNYGKEVKGLPNSIEILYNECRKCFSNGCFTSAVLIARKLLMNIAVEQGADKNKNFIFYVDYLDENGFIPPNGKEWVDFIRIQGNEATHEIIIKDKKNAKKVIDFLGSLLLFMYELPAMIHD